MAYYQQNARQMWPRNGTAPTSDNYPHSLPTYQPSELPPSMTNAGTTQPSGGFRAEPVHVYAPPVFGTHDALGGQLMRVAQSDGFNSAVGPWPRAGVHDEPGAGIAASAITRLAPSTSAHPGLTLATGAGPTMVYIAPPVFSVQSRPIYAVGL